VIHVQAVTKVFSIPHLRRTTLFERILAGGYTYETFDALKDVSLSAKAGEFVGVLGKNGSGKSTLLRVVAGIYPPTSGVVTVAGRVAPILDLGVGFQGRLRVADNVFLYGILLGIPRQRLRDDLDEVLDYAGVRRFADARLETLSLGFRMRLAFTIALRADAPVLLIDEALAVGDAAFRGRCLEALQRLHARGCTALIVSHEESLLRQLCQRAVVLKDGRVHSEGSTEAMIELYQNL